MAYRVKREQTVKAAGIVNIAKSQLDKAMEEIDDEELDRHEAVHQVRQHCKKLRGLIRPIRPAFSDYRKEDVFFRDAAGELSSVCDTQSVIECFDDLAECYENRADVALFQPIQRKTADDLADLPGDDHDLAVLQEILEKESQCFGDGAELERIFAGVDERRSGLQHQARFLGGRLSAEKRKHIAKRCGS